MTATPNPPHSNSLFQELAELTKSALYRIAQSMGITGRSTMSKQDLVDALSEKPEETKPIMEQFMKSDPARKAALLEKIPSAAAKSETNEVVTAPPARPAPAPQTALETASVTSGVPAPAPAAPVAEPAPVWEGEEGPELPGQYGVTVLRAMPRDPHWVCLYWEISEETRNSIRAEEGEWFFDIADPCLLVYDESGRVIQDVPILLDAHNWYLNLAHSQTYEFELGLKGPEGKFRSLARSNRVTLPPREPSTVTDEHWSMVSEEFQDVLQHAGGLDFAAGGGSSAGVTAHVLRQRARVPWNITTEQWPSSQAWPSSHALPSSHNRPKK
ncbi:MAG: DUF4912 domain-containing protein [bacterium]